MQYDVLKIDIMMSEVLILEPKSNKHEFRIVYPIKSKLYWVLIHNILNITIGKYSLPSIVSVKLYLHYVFLESRSIVRFLEIL